MIGMLCAIGSRTEHVFHIRHYQLRYVNCNKRTGLTPSPMGVVLPKTRLAVCSALLYSTHS